MRAPGEAPIAAHLRHADGTAHRPEMRIGERNIHAKLTEQDVREIRKLRAEGWRVKDIAQKFSISEDTVKHHLTNIFNKVGVSNRLELALFAVHHKLVDTV